MKHEDYVSFEQAKALKELGFDWECQAYFEDYLDELNRHHRKFRFNAVANDMLHKDFCSAPTLVQAQKWLREIKRTIIAVIPKYEMQCDGTHTWEYWYEIYNSTGKRLYAEPAATNEYALELAIDKALELLKEENNGK